MRRLGRYLVALTVFAMSLPGVAWAAETVAAAVSTGCCPCCG